MPVADSCELCKRVALADDGEGDVFLRHDLVTAYRSPANVATPGWCQLQVNRHAGNVAQLTREEASCFGKAMQVIGLAIVKATRVQRIYSYSICENVEHYHIVLGPRPGGSNEVGAPLLKRVLSRDPRLRDPEEASRVAARLKEELASVGGSQI